jgi:hypothetical protein
MNVCLVSAPTVTDLEDPAVAEDEAVRRVAQHPPLGLLSLAAVLELQGIVPHLLDLNSLYCEYLHSKDEPRRAPGFCSFAARKLEGASFEVFGFSSICNSYPLTLRIARKAKRIHPGARIVLGGPQASAVDVETLRAFPFVDAVVRGEAEHTLPLLLDAISHPHSWDAIPGITFRRRQRIVRNRNAPLILDLDSLPLPAFHLYPDLRHCGSVPLELGRGCPFACKFCSTSGFFRRRFRLKSPHRVIEQMRQVKQLYGVDGFELIHDTFTVDRARVAEFCRALLESKEKFRWNCSARTDCIDDELIALMARAGCRGLFFGIEAGSERLQREINKNLDLSEAALRIRCANKHRIRTAVSLITGFPTETGQDLRKTVGFLLDSARFEHTRPQFHLLEPLAGSALQARYRDRLCLDNIPSEASPGGWRQDPADQRLIEGHPEVFPNFYALPTAWLERRYLKELAEFILYALERCRRLLVALHQDSGDLLAVFDAWKAWRLEAAGNGFASGEDRERYYASVEFRQDFLEFVASRYLRSAGRGRLAIATLLEFERALDQSGGQSAVVSQEPAAPADSLSAPHRNTVFRLAQGARVIRLGADYKRIVQCLRRKGRLERIPAGPVVLIVRASAGKDAEVVQLSSLSAQLVSLCDGRRTAGRIAELIPSLGEGLEGISKQKGCLFGLEMLRRQAVLEHSGRL